jgi:hypothetical protein
MRQSRSADPWSTFLTTSGRGGGPGNPHVEPRSEPRRDDASGLADDCRRVLKQLDGGPRTVEQIHHATGLGLLEVADAVEVLRDRGLVTVEREVDEVVRRT